MSAGSRFVLPYQTVIDGAGVPLPGALLHFYASGTDTPLNTYADSSLATPNTNPVVANAAGEFPNIFLSSAAYKVVLTDDLGVQQWTADPVVGFGATVPGAGYAFDTTATLLAFFGAGITLSNGTQASTTGRSTVGDGGGGLFYYKASDSTTADNGGTIRVDAQNRRWYALNVGEGAPITMFGAVGDGVTDCTAAVQNAINAGNIIVPAATFVIGGGNVQISIPSNRSILGTEGSTFQASSTFATVVGADATYRFLFNTTGASEITVTGVAFTLSAASAVQSKLSFTNCSEISIKSCSFEENGSWDVLFNNCTNFSFDNNEMTLGNSGVNLGVGLRICNASSDFSVTDNVIRGALVTKNQIGGGGQPTGDKWGSVAINIDNGTTAAFNSTGFKSGQGIFKTDGTGNPVVVSVPGITAAAWKAWVQPQYNLPIPAIITASITANVMTVTAVNGQLAIGDALTDSTATLVAGRKITAFGTGSGGLGTYTVTAGADVGSETMTAIPGTFDVTIQQIVVTITADTLTFTGVPGVANLLYDYQYAFFGSTPQRGTLQGNHVSGMTNAAISVINGIDIDCVGNYLQHVGDVGWDAEGSLSCSFTSNELFDCNAAGIAAGFNSQFCANAIRQPNTLGLSVFGDQGAGYQSFNYNGSDFGSAQVESVNVTVGAAVNNVQALAGSSSCFKYLAVGEWWRNVTTGYEYAVVTKTDDNGIAVDNSQVRQYQTPRTFVGVAQPIGTGTLTSGQWKKSPSAAAIYGLQGDCIVTDNTFDTPTVAITGSYMTSLYLGGNLVGGNGVQRAYEITQFRGLTVTGGKLTGWTYFSQGVGLNMQGVTLSYSNSRAILLSYLQVFNVGNCVTVDEASTSSGSPSMIYGNCSYGTIHDMTLSLVQGYAANIQPTLVEATYDKNANTFDTANANNVAVDVHKIGSFKDGQIWGDYLVTFAVNNATPTVAVGENFKTANALATTITNFVGGFIGKRIKVVANDANTTIQNNAAIKTATAADLTPASGQAFSFQMFSAGVWSQL